MQPDSSFVARETARSRSAESLERALAELLAGPECEPGARLPTERAMAERFAVSRSAVRTALARLEARGKIVRKIGSGTYIADPHAPGAGPAETRPSDASPQEIMETRILIEPRLAGLIVANANGADIARIHEALCNAEQATTHEEFELWDGRFHQALAEATHNRLMIDVFQTITQARDQAEWGELKRRSVTEERRRRYDEEHRAIFDALQARDGALAEACLLRHLSNVRRNLLGY